METLPCSAIVYRAMARKDWIDPVSGTVLPGAFIRRPAPKDEDGLSLDVDGASSCARALNKCFGVASLHVGRIRDIGLDVIVDDRPHASIRGVPRTADDKLNAERIASQLARKARLVPPAQHQPAE